MQKCSNRIFFSYLFLLSAFLSFCSFSPFVSLIIIKSVSISFCTFSDMINCFIFLPLYSEVQIQQFPYSAYYLLPYLLLISKFVKKSTVKQTVHLILCNWLPFYRPCSFASQTFIWFADFLIITFKRMQKNWFYYTMALYCTQEKHYHFNVQKQKKRTADTYTRTVLLLPKSTQH